MSFERFLKMYPKYKIFKNNKTVQAIYNYLSEARSIDCMLQACNNDKPALNGVLQIENLFADRADFDLKNKTNRQLVGSMIREILLDFGYLKNIQRTLTGKYFQSATHYNYCSEKATKRIIKKVIIEDIEAPASGSEQPAPDYNEMMMVKIRERKEVAKTRNIEIKENWDMEKKAWEYALGIIKVDGLTPSPEFLELVEKEKRGEITTEDIIKILDKKYKMKGEGEDTNA